jgi:hypothetical protein
VSTHWIPPCGASGLSALLHDAIHAREIAATTNDDIRTPSIHSPGVCTIGKLRSYLVFLEF